MSSQKGNSSRTRPQKYRNKTVFKNNLNDSSQRTKLINTIQVSDVCVRCKEIIEWKIKYKKYKPLTQPKTCVKCGQKSVKQAYHIICTECGKTGVCTKCGQKKEVKSGPNEREQLNPDNEENTLLQSLPERKRRTLIRHMRRNEETSIKEQEMKRDSVIDKLTALKINNLDEFIDSDVDDLEDKDNNFML